jgi:hypothetical protein
VLKRIVLAAALLTGGSTATWKAAGIGEYFGRVDVSTWSGEHPEAPPPAVEFGKQRVRVSDTRRIVPSEGLAAQFQVQTANNNLDVIRHEGRVYLAWRSAPSHFASPQTVMHIASSEDEQHWRFEKTYQLGRDLREPRFLSINGRLMLYVSRLGQSAWSFEPQGLSIGELRSGGGWSELAPVGPPGAIAWRVKPFQGEALMIAYRGGEHLYSFDGGSMSVEMWRTRDGRNFRPFSASGSAVSRGGGSEADFALGSDGSLYGVVRNEEGDSSGWGSKLCRANADSLEQWTCKTDPRKYDSPLVFEHDGEVYVVGRRNVTADGAYDLGEGSGLVRTVKNELAYIAAAKRCALWRWVPGEVRLAFVLDLPSRGDTCFPSVISGDTPNQVVLYDYSSDIAGPDLPWSAGQRRPTYVYRHVLTFE